MKSIIEELDRWLKESEREGTDAYYELKAMQERTRNSDKIKGLIENHNGNTVNWISVELDQLKGTVVAEPAREDMDIPIDEHLIVELYSK